MLRERNKKYGTIKFVDISSDEYSPKENEGLDYETVCKRTIYVNILCIYCDSKYDLMSKLEITLFSAEINYRL